MAKLRDDNDTDLKEAMLYEKGKNGKVTCNLCAHRCSIAEGKQGICQVRENRDGTLYSLVYGRTIAQHVDPIEKKPLYHFLPGTAAYSIATAGCNFRCRWCQNWDISQMPREKGLIVGEKASPQEIVNSALRSGCRSIAYTYTEPTIFSEYAYDTAKLAHEAGLANIFVSNGYMTREMLETFQPYLDAANVDLKAFSDKTYRKHIGARLQPVLDSLVNMKELGIWLEVTTLVVPGINDSPDELREAAGFISNKLGRGTPWHISAFHASYKMADVPRTSIAILRQARQIGREEGLDYIYIGNVAEEAAQDTLCPSCGTILVGRRSYFVTGQRVEENRCPQCGITIAGVWD